MTHLDLFSGIGGFAIAAQNCGYTTVGFCEREPYAQQILKERFGAVLADADERRGEQRNSEKRGLPKPHAGNPRLHPDIFTLDGADYAGVDLLTGGFPCQPFSVAGKRLGKADDRHLWPQIVRLLQEMDAAGGKPAWCLFENVPGIIPMELDNILSDLESVGYSAWPLVIPACAVDARHRRDRVWIVAHAISLRELQSSGSFADERRRISHESEDVAHADGQRGCLREAHGSDASDARQSPCTWKDEREWFAESGLGRVAYGIPNRAHRLRGLGNAICPQVCEEILRAICSIEGGAK